MKRNDVMKILDVNFNRSREGLRVCEEVARFILKDASLTRNLKKARHSVSGLLKNKNFSYFDVVSARDIRADFGKKPSTLEKKRKNTLDLFIANIERSKESLRVLEESLKFVDEKASDKIKKIRFDVYSIEKRSLPKLETLRHHE